MKKIILVAVSIVFLVAGMAQAGTFKLNGPSGTSVTIHDPIGTAGTLADMYSATFNSQNYKVFCTDYATINWNTQYANYSMIALPELAAYKEAAYIYDKFGSKGAVAQLAVWEVVFEQLTAGGTAGDVKGGNNFYVTNKGGFTDADLALANTYVADALLNGKNFNTSNYRLIVSPNADRYYGVQFQDFITRVPEPASMLLFGLGLLGLAVLRRKFKKSN